MMCGGTGAGLPGPCSYAERKKAMGLLQSFFESDFWQRHIYNNFIAENRWTYLTNGLKNTVIITLAALVIGILLGAVVAVVRVTHDKAGRPGILLRLFNAVCQFYLTVIRGTPVMVQLLIMYFVVFATVDPGKLAVAIIAFGVNSGAYVAEIFRSGIMSVDPGQMEAGRSLGLSYSQVMLRVIMPQAIKNILPTLNNEFIALVKETAVVGYIALGSVENPSGVLHTDGPYYTAGAAAGSITVSTPNSAVTGYLNNGKIMAGAVPDPDTMLLAKSGTRLMTSFLEGSGTDLATEFSNMIVYQRGYQANTRIVTVTDTMLEELVNMKR